MECLAAQPTTEELKSFDLLANVDALRFDIERYGYVLPETREQVGNEQLSYLSEGIDRASRTAFVLRRTGNDLVYFDDGRWRPYSNMLDTGLAVARREASEDSRRQFLAEWAENDYYHYSHMRQLRPGEQYAWASPYPHDMEKRYGADFMQECGLRPDRKMGYLYRARCNADGTVVLESQTIDRSDDGAIAVALQVSRGSSVNMDALVQAYDNALVEKHGGSFYAGRRHTELHENGWEQIAQNRDLIEYLLNGLEVIARKTAPRAQQEAETKRHIYGVWALFKKRLDGTAQAVALPVDSAGYMATQVWLEREVRGAYCELAAQGRPLVGCGGAITMSSGEADIISASSEDIKDSIFSSSGHEESYGFNKKMYCVVCQAPPKEKEAKKMCGPCGICRACDAKFKK